MIKSMPAPVVEPPPVKPAPKPAPSPAPKPAPTPAPDPKPLAPTPEPIEPNPPCYPDDPDHGSCPIQPRRAQINLNFPPDWEYPELL